ADHAQACAFAESAIAEQRQRAALASGAGLVERQAAAIRNSCRPTTGRKKTGRSRNPALLLAMHGARAAKIPEGYARDLARLAAEDNGDGFLALDGNGAVGTGFATSASVIAGRRTRRAVRMSDQHLAAADSEGSDTNHLLHRLAEAAWLSGGTGIMFDSAANSWNTCKASGAVRSPAAGADFIFLDDSACPRASIDLAAFAGGGTARNPLFDTFGFAAATVLWTIALDISVMNTAMPTMRLAARSWEFRPLGLGADNLAGMLMSCGIAYDSAEGRAMCAAIMALMTATAYAASAGMARELGPFPGFERNRDHMLGVIRRHRQAATGRQQVETPPCPDAALEQAARHAWDRALALGEKSGFRNAQATLLSGARADTQLAGHHAAGIEPGAAVTRYERLPGGGFRKTINRPAAHALKALGYSTAQIDDILLYVLGHGSLESAPGINHESLRRRGFDGHALERMEATMPSALEIGMVFNPWNLGEKFCTHMLGFRTRDIDDPDFDILAGLGFSNAAIEAANTYCCGADTLEGAPHLKDEHLAVFDGAGRTGRQGARRVSTEARIRMMAAAQPLVSGGVGSGITVPEAASVGDCRAAFRLAWRLGLKILMVQREGAGIEAGDVAAPTARTEYDDASIATAAALVSGDLPEAARAKGGFLIYDGGLAKDDAAPRRVTPREAEKPDPAASPGMSQALAIACTARALADQEAARKAASSKNRTCSDGGKEQPAATAETSRRSSQDAARSAASVPSSADAVVKHRHS
ncbi:MAG: hypothetical protein ACTSQV_06885, partial [Alphaproteobacteria bacterium]